MRLDDTLEALLSQMTLEEKIGQLGIFADMLRPFAADVNPEMNELNAGELREQIRAGRVGARLCLGVAVMLLLAAFVEAFWSSTQSVPAWLKYTVSAVLWAGVLVWLWRGGDGHPAEEHGDAP